MAAVGATVLKAVTSPLPVRAAGDDGAAINVGDTIADAQAQTTLGNKANNNIVLWAASNDDLGHGAGIGLAGYSAKNVGVYGESKTGYAVKALSTGFHAIQGTSGRPAGGYGVHGISNSSSSGAGVKGESQSSYGVEGSSVSSTAVFGFSSNFVGVWGQASSSGAVGVMGRGPVGVKGVTSDASEPAVFGSSQASSTGVLGFSGATGDTEPDGAKKVGVLGIAHQDAGSRGVAGRSRHGHGIHGESHDGAALYGESSDGYAIHGSGRVRFEKVSGVATIKAGATRVTVSPGVNVTSNSFVLLTPKANIGTRPLWFTTDGSHNKLTIHIGSSRSNSTKVAWLLLG